MNGQYNYFLVTLSILVAALGAYTALSLAERMFQSQGAARRLWLAAGACALGVGIWSMHFIGMLALRMPIAFAYEWSITALSLVAAIVASIVVLYSVTRPTLAPRDAVVGTLALGTGVSVMHYAGMGAMQIAPGIRYDFALVAASVVVAALVAAVAMGIVYAMRLGALADRASLRAGIAIVMGLAISSMHYTGMSAAHFDANSVCTGESDISTGWLAGSIALFTLMTMGIGIVSAIVDAHMSSKIQRFNTSLTLSNDSLKKANDNLARLANFDVLTGLPNRALVNVRLAKLLAAREATEQVVVIFIDLDRFKVINDSLGHHVGDLFLQAVAERLTAAMQPTDTLGRLGGDEFVIIFRRPAGVQEAAVLAKRILAELAERFHVNGHELHVSASLGISVGPEDGATPAALIVSADAAMYHAKQRGRNNFQLYEPRMGTFAQDRLDLENGLRRALQNNEFELHYQPKVDVRSGRMVSCEALIRWRHPEKGLIYPADFIPAAEETGLIAGIGEWVIHEACRQAKLWQSVGLDPLRIAVNVSALQFHQEHFVDTIVSALEQSGLSSQCLEIELTESAVMTQPDKAIQMLTAIDRLGVHISIDDFGTGYSSLAYLRQLPINKLKIDRTFIKGLIENSQDSSIVSAIISMAHNLHLEVIAEGVETPEQLAILRSLGCDQFQGYLFSPPVAPAKAALLMGQAGTLETRRAKDVAILA